MISKLLKKGELTALRENCLNHCQEVADKKLIVYELICSTAREEKENTKQIESPIPILCEAYVALLRIEMQLGTILFKNTDKPQIRFTDNDALIYQTFYASLKVYESELKQMFRIMLAPQQEVS